MENVHLDSTFLEKYWCKEQNISTSVKFQAVCLQVDNL